MQKPAISEISHITIFLKMNFSVKKQQFNGPYSYIRTTAVSVVINNQQKIPGTTYFLKLCNL